MFASNLLAYSVTRSKLVLNIYGKLHPAGGITTAMDVPQVPGGDILAAIDNDQVLIKKWTVRKDTEAQMGPYKVRGSEACEACEAHKK